MRIKKETLDRIAGREVRLKGDTYYQVNYFSYGYDPEYIAEVQTKNKEYLFFKGLGEEDYEQISEVYRK